MMSGLPKAPYPSNTKAKGWRFELDYERIEQSSTWALAAARGPEMQGWLLKMWLISWRQVPCGSFPAEEEVIAAMIGMPAKVWAKQRDVMMRGWWRADDGRVYHETVSSRVAEMLKKRRSDADRQAANRALRNQDSGATHADVTRDTDVSPGEVGRESSTDNRIPNTEDLSGKGIGVPKTKTARKRAAAPASPAPLVSVQALAGDGVSEQHAAEWLAIRKVKALPLTLTAWEDTKAEAAKAGLQPAEAVRRCVTEGWAGFRASWLQADAAPKAARRAAPLSEADIRSANEAANAEALRLLQGGRSSPVQPLELIHGNG